MIRILAFVTLLGLIVYAVVLRRQLSAAQLRGDMYHDIAVRLDKRVAELTTK